MARSDLVLDLVENGIKGDLVGFKQTAQALAADASAKQHHHLADKLLSILTEAPSPLVAQPIQLTDTQIQDAFYELRASKTFGDLIFKDDISSLCQEVVEEHNRRDLLRSYNLEPRHRILLSGAPGNGKTTLAEAFATHLMVPFYVVKYEGIVRRYLGDSAQQLDKLFEFIKTRRCVLFFDEFDAIGKERDDEQESGEIKRVVNALLKQIDMLPSHVVVIAATNHESMLDSAMWRRFQLQLELPKPTHQLALKWFEQFSQKVGYDWGYSTDELATKLTGLSFAELQEFALDVQRRYVLGLPDSEHKISDIICSRLIHWQNRYTRD